MAKYLATIIWDRKDAPFTDGRYSRAHRWQFDGGVIVRLHGGAAGLAALEVKPGTRRPIIPAEERQFVAATPRGNA